MFKVVQPQPIPVDWMRPQLLPQTGQINFRLIHGYLRYTPNYFSLVYCAWFDVLSNICLIGILC